jgi:hypothetical protein
MHVVFSRENPKLMFRGIDRNKLLQAERGYTKIERRQSTAKLAEESPQHPTPLQHPWSSVYLYGVEQTAKVSPEDIKF